MFNQDLANLFKLSEELTESNKITEKTTVEAIIDQKKEELGDKLIQTPLVFGSTGLMISGDTLTKTKYLDALALDENLYKNIYLTEDQAKQFSRSLTKATAGGVTAAAPMMCRGSRCKFKETCVTGDTEVLLYDGTTEKIKDISSRDKLLIWSFDTSSRQMQKDLIVSAVKRPAKMVYKITSIHGHQINATSDHLFLARKGGDRFSWISIEDGLREGYFILFTDAYYNEEVDSDMSIQEYGDCFITRIQSIEELGKQVVYDIQVARNSNFFANGILVHNCELERMNKAPVGAPCIYEQVFLREKTEAYFEEFDITADRPTEMHLVAELAELDLYERRATQMLALQDQDMSQEDVMGFDNNGNAIIKEDISKYFNLKERIKRQRLKILESLSATRKERAKIAATMLNQSSESAETESIKDKLDLLLKTRASEGGYIDPSVQEVLNVKKEKEKRDPYQKKWGIL